MKATVLRKKVILACSNLLSKEYSNLHHLCKSAFLPSEYWTDTISFIVNGQFCAGKLSQNCYILVNHF